MPTPRRLGMRRRQRTVDGDHLDRIHRPVNADLAPEALQCVAVEVQRRGDGYRRAAIVGSGNSAPIQPVEAVDAGDVVGSEGTSFLRRETGADRRWPQLHGGRSAASALPRRAHRHGGEWDLCAVEKVGGGNEPCRQCGVRRSNGSEQCAGGGGVDGSETPLAEASLDGSPRVAGRTEAGFERLRGQIAVEIRRTGIGHVDQELVELGLVAPSDPDDDLDLGVPVPANKQARARNAFSRGSGGNGEGGNEQRCNGQHSDRWRSRTPRNIFRRPPPHPDRSSAADMPCLGLRSEPFERPTGADRPLPRVVTSSSNGKKRRERDSACRLQQMRRGSVRREGRTPNAGHLGHVRFDNAEQLAT